MMSDSLTRFANTLYAEATEEKEKIEKQLEENERRALSGCEAELSEKYRRETERARRRLVNEKRLAISKREVELMTALREMRRTAAEEVIGDVEERLREFASGSGYEEYLRREASVAEMFTRGTTVCMARECDFDLLREIIKIKDIVFEAAGVDTIGGFVLKNTDIGILADCTLKNKLDENKELFLEISGLVID